MEMNELDDPIVLKTTVWQHNEALIRLAVHVNSICDELRKRGIDVPLPERRPSPKRTKSGDDALS